MEISDEVRTWLLDSDPAIRWQVLRDLEGASADAVAAERGRVAKDGWGKRLLDLQEGGAWANGACFPSRDWRPTMPVVGDGEAQPWVATFPTLSLLRILGIDPANPLVRKAIDDVRNTVTWEYDDLPFFDGEVEPCINGTTVGIGSYFGQDVDVIVRRLLGEQLDDGGWNCEAERGSTRSSFNTTICVLDGLLEYERSGGAIPVAEARDRGQEYLLTRHLMNRASTGEVADEDWLQFSFPYQWHYDVLRGLDHFRAAGNADERLTDAIELARSKQQSDGTWLLENTHPGLMYFEMEDGDGRPSRWNTLRALRVLSWWERVAR